MKTLTSAREAAEAQMTYRAFLNRNPKRSLFVRRNFLSSLQRTPLDATALAPVLLSEEIEQFQRATPVFVTDNADQLIREAASLLPPDEMLLATERADNDLMLWFETPYQYGLLVDNNGVKISEDWNVVAINIRRDEILLSDNTTGPGLVITLYAHIAPINELAPIDMIGVACEETWSGRDIASWAKEIKAWVVAMHRLMGDHVERERVAVDRAARRRLDRLDFPKDGYITELRLRKSVYEETDRVDDGGLPLRLRFRHRVRGHWRKFYCASLGPVGTPSAYRYRFVNDYVRGPRSTPLVESSRVITLAN